VNYRREKMRKDAMISIMMMVIHDDVYTSIFWSRLWYLDNKKNDKQQRQTTEQINIKNEKQLECINIEES